MAKWFAYSALMAGGYFLAGRFGQLLAVPPSYPTAIWPASGIVLAGLLLLGYRVWPGLFVGALLVNGWTPLLTAESFEAAQFALLKSASISAGATVQALTGAFLIRRFIGFPNTLIQDRAVLGFLLLGGPLACLIGASWGIATLAFMKEIDRSLIALNWWTWWVGDVIGVIIFAPLVLICFARPRRAWRPRLLSVALPLCVAFAVVVVGFVATQILQQSLAKPRFDAMTSNACQRLEEQILGHIEILHSVESFYSSSDNVERNEFAVFNRHIIARHPGTRAVAWLPMVMDEERKEFESRSRAEGQPDYVISELASDKSLVSSQKREEYFPIYYIEPQQAIEVSIGFDVASNPVWRDAMDDCRDSGQRVATCLSVLEGKDNKQLCMLIFEPIYSGGEVPSTVALRQSSLRGFVLGVFSVADTIRAALPKHDTNEFHFTINDESIGKRDRLIYAGKQDASAHKASEVAPFMMQEIVSTETIRIADLKWVCEFTPTSEFYASQTNRYTWLILACALSMTALLGAFLLILSGRTARIEASESRYLDLYENAPDMFVSIDMTTQRVVECNKTLTDATGFSRTEIIDRQIFQLFEKDSQTEVRRALASFLVNERIEDIELQLLCSDGHLIETSMNIVAVSDGHGDYAYCRAALRDITARKRIETQIKEQELELAHVARLSMMGEMAAGLAHEINQPLAAIAAYAEGAAIRIRDGKLDTKALTHVIGQISADALRAGEVIRRLRQYVRKREPDHCEVDMNELVKEVTHFVDPDVKHREVRIALDLEERLPTFNGDAVQIQQVLLNLVRNACEAMADTDPTHRNLTIRTQSNGQDIINVDVDDCGHGLPEDSSEEMFDAFFSSSESGLGMGLAISRSIIESHGGRIWATPLPEGGASFHFSLPASKE